MAVKIDKYMIYPDFQVIFKLGVILLKFDSIAWLAT